MNLEQLKEAMAEALAKAKAIDDGAKASETELTDEQVSKMTQYLDEAEGHKAQIEKLEAAMQVSQRLADLEEAPKPKSVKAQNIHPSFISEVKELSDEDPKGGYKSPKYFMLDVLHAGKTGQVRPKLKRFQDNDFQATAGSDEQGGYSDPYGGFLVPEAFAPGILMVNPEMDAFGARTTKVPMTASTVTFNARVDKDHSDSVTGGLRVYRRSEADEVSASRTEYEQVSLVANPLMGVAYATKEIMQDSPVSFAAILEQGFDAETTSKLMDERINGTGVGEYEGMLTSPALIEVAKETGQDADTIVYNNIIKMRARVWGYQNAIWIANQDVIPQLPLLNLSVGTGGVPVWMPSAREDLPDTILGRPVIFTEYAQTLGDKGDLICANPTQYLEGERTGTTFESSIHVRWVQAEEAFRSYTRNDGKCWWREALTPKNSTTTLSPFVTLAERA